MEFVINVVFAASVLCCSKAALEVMELDGASLWWAGKEIVRGKQLSDFVGKNEKTKIVCKLQKVYVVLCASLIIVHLSV